MPSSQVPERTRTPSLTLADQIARRLESCGPVRTRLRIDVKDNIATLSGVATSFYQRQIWLHAAASVPGITQVIDCIEVPATVN
jgi:osmotically-inducible protein OsmY